MEQVHNGFKVGDEVLFNGGFEGIVTALCDSNLLEIRGARGIVCISAFDKDLTKPTQPTTDSMTY